MVTTTLNDDQISNSSVTYYLDHIETSYHNDNKKNLNHNNNFQDQYNKIDFSKFARSVSQEQVLKCKRFLHHGAIKDDNVRKKRDMRGGKCQFAIESKTFEVSLEQVRGKLRGIIVERSRGFSSWIRFGVASLRKFLEGLEECCREEKK